MTRPLKPATPGRDPRLDDLTRIHVLKKQLRWSDDHYRDVMSAACNGVRSAADLDFTGRRRWIDHMQACVRAMQPGAAKQAKLSPKQGLIWSLWQRLADAGRVSNRTMPALAAYIDRQTGVARLEWLNAAQQDLVIDSLKAWLTRPTPATGTQPQGSAA